MPMRLNVGKEFDQHEAELVEQVGNKAVHADFVRARVTANENQTRTYAMVWTLGLVSVFVSGAAILGIIDGSYDELQGTWAVAGPIGTSVLTYYFGGTNGDSNSAPGR